MHRRWVSSLVAFAALTALPMLGCSADRPITDAIRSYFAAIANRDCDALLRTTVEQDASICGDLDNRSQQMKGAALEYGKPTIEGDCAVQPLTVGGAPMQIEVTRVGDQWLVNDPPGLQPKT